MVRVDREQSIQNILNNPTPEERIRWEGMSPEQIRADIEAYLETAIPKRIHSIQNAQDIVAELDHFAAALDPRRNKGR